MLADAAGQYAAAAAAAELAAEAYGNADFDFASPSPRRASARPPARSRRSAIRCTARSASRTSTRCISPRAGCGPGATSSATIPTGRSASVARCAAPAAKRCGRCWSARNSGRTRETTAAVTTTPADGPLGGIRVLDLTSVIMGPFATHVLADLGADVIKVESPEGDSLRHYEPLRHPGMSGSFLNLHRNKRSIVLDLKRPECRAALNRLIESADVFVHSLRPKTIERLGYGYEQVRAIKPDIVYCGASGFGASRALRRQARLRRPDPGRLGHGGAARASAWRAGLRAHRDLRQARGAGDRLRDPGCVVPARARRRRSGDRSADAGDQHRVQSGRAHGRLRLRAAARQARATRAC